MSFDEAVETVEGATGLPLERDRWIGHETDIIQLASCSDALRILRHERARREADAAADNT